MGLSSARQMITDISACPRTSASLARARVVYLVGATLVNRTTRQDSLTDVGRTNLQRCRRILEDVRAADEAIASGIDAPSGELRLTAPFSVGTTLPPRILAEYLRTYPRVKIDSSSAIVGWISSRAASTRLSAPVN